ncbi:MAG TPA: toprim domain-containing protein [Anaerohalosphaeraceae bacterium]|nr:toprim domain-containing protein [Anaerohalosphaeraceae bacterium]
MYDRVSRNRPCPICNKPDWCGISKDGSLVICMRVPSDKKTKNGGWLHRIGPSSFSYRDTVQKPQESPKNELDRVDMMTRLACKYEESAAEKVRELAGMLGVSEASLRRLNCGWTGREWSFPMRNESEMIIGIALRHPSGKKRAVRGSKIGLFIPERVQAAKELWICEGPTDCAALLDCGLNAIGRQGCNVLMEMIGRFVRPRQRIVIVADNDPFKISNIGERFCPGIDGAKRLARHLKSEARCSVKVIVPPKKDVRETLVALGLTKCRHLLSHLSTTG